MRLCRDAWGVDVDRSAQGPFRARISYQGRTYLIARFNDLESAKRAYDQAAIALHGPQYQRLNYQDSVQRAIEDPKLSQRIQTILAMAREREQEQANDSGAGCNKKRRRTSACTSDARIHWLSRCDSMTAAQQLPLSGSASPRDDATAAAEASAAAWLPQQQQQQQQQHLLLELRNSLQGHAVEALDSWIIKDLPFLDEWLHDCQLPHQLRQLAPEQPQPQQTPATPQAGTETADTCTPAGPRPLDHQASSSAAAMAADMAAAGLPQLAGAAPAAASEQQPAAAGWQLAPLNIAGLQLLTPQGLPMVPLVAGLAAAAGPSASGNSQSSSGAASPTVVQQLAAGPQTCSLQAAAPGVGAGVGAMPAGTVVSGAAGAVSAAPGGRASSADGLLDLSQSMGMLEMLIHQSTSLYAQLRSIAAAASAAGEEHARPAPSVHSQLAASTAFARWWLATQKAAGTPEQQQCLQLISSLMHG